MSLPLEGIKVLDLSRFFSGPFCSQILADYGAEVIKIEDPQFGDPYRVTRPFIGEEGSEFYVVNRNKRSLCMDLSKEEAKVIFKQLAARSDVVLEAFRPGVMDKLGLGYEQLKKINKRIIYCSLNGYGSTGPMSQAAAHDINFVSMAGIAELTGTKDSGPALSAVQMGGTAGGSMYALSAILMAIISRDRSGEGQYCEVAMLDGAISLMGYALAEWVGWQRLAARGNDTLTGLYACYQFYETRDHKYFGLGAVENKFWEQFCLLIGCPQYIDWQDDLSRQEEMKAAITGIIASKDRDEWMAIFADKDSCLTPVLNFAEMMNDPQIKAREMFFTLENFKNSGKDLTISGLPIKFSDTPGELKPTFPDLGEHNGEILSDLGYSADDIKLLKIKAVI